LQHHHHQLEVEEYHHVSITPWISEPILSPSA
jgi:hypothetical protein